MAKKLSFDEVNVLIREELSRDDESFFLRTDGVPLFREPVVGVQRGDDLSFAALKEPIPVHMTPLEIWENEFGIAPKQLSVLSFAMPFDLKTVGENAEAVEYPAATWFEAKLKCFKAAESVLVKIQANLNEKGIKNLRPGSSKSYKLHKQANGFEHPTWSERHVAYVCGVGTFGLHGALITPKGCTHRLASLLIESEFDHYSVMAQSPFADCLFLQKGTCGACIKRCPADAINKENRRLVPKCREIAYIRNQPKCQEMLGEATGGCAFCNVKVPCAIKSPMRVG